MNKLELLKFAKNNNIYIVRHKYIDQVSEINNYSLDHAQDSDLDRLWDQVNALEIDNANPRYNISINLHHPTLNLNQIKTAVDKYAKYATCRLKTSNITVHDLKRAKSLCFNDLSESALYDILSILNTQKV